MLGLIIRDQVRWHNRWSSEIGRRFSVLDSTNNIYVFDDRHSRDEIESVLGEAPSDIYQFVTLQEAPEEGCDFLLDSGRCYVRVQ